VAYYTITLSEGSLSQRTDAFAILLETHAGDAREWSIVDTYRADGALGNTNAERFIESYPSRRNTPNSGCIIVKVQVQFSGSGSSKYDNVYAPF